jgi:dolichyl-phosphate beta-glucosyltransferase
LQLSIIIPCFNDAVQTLQNAKRVDAFLARFEPSISYEIILVEDGSAPEQCFAACPDEKKLPRSIKIVSYEKNQGKGHAVKVGMQAATGACRLFTDADLPYGVDVITPLYFGITEEQRDLIFGDRLAPQSTTAAKVPFLRRLASFVMINGINRLLVGKAVDTQCGIKAFSASAAKKIFALTTCDRFAFDIEIWLLAGALGMDIKQVAVRLENQGRSSVRVIADSFRLIVDTLSIKRRLASGSYNFREVLQDPLLNYDGILHRDIMPGEDLSA